MKKYKKQCTKGQIIICPTKDGKSVKLIMENSTRFKYLIKKMFCKKYRDSFEDLVDNVKAANK